MEKAKAHHGGDWKQGFLFLGNQLALDFVNTRPRMNGEFVELLPDVPALLRWFHAAGLLKSEESVKLGRRWQSGLAAQKLLQFVRELRERWREDIVALESGGKLRPSTLREINQLLAEHPMLLRLDYGKKVTTEPWFALEKPNDLLAPLAHHAAKLFTEADPTRLRQCGSCILHFLDTSKKGNRQWCSMNLCGNRFKVAAYAARKRAQVGDS